MDKKQEEDALHNNFRTLVQAVIQAGMSGTPMHERILELGPTPQLLIDHGFSALPLIIKAKTVDKICFDHGVATTVIERMPKWGCKPEPPKFPSCQFHPFHKGIQVNHLAVTLKGIVSVQQNVSPGCRRYLGERRERLGVTCCFALR